ncbi:hypothetical protein U9M48_040704 [Paspalum notatum var. saurae]|uniref:Glucosamine inositolphosphorylceramide transferase 1 N-terminal domain-containing protein n=1 Tax=Paspalum notatum var. saurae TaxID=547442 RepID=A0AAQ3UR71_PASNO
MVSGEPVVTCANMAEAGFPSSFVADPFLFIQWEEHGVSWCRYTTNPPLPIPVVIRPPFVFYRCAKTKHMPIDLLFLDEEIESKNYFMPNLQAGASSSAHAEDEKVDAGLPLVGFAIRPGIAPNVKFGGSRSYPDLPWVSTTGCLRMSSCSKQNF